MSSETQTPEQFQKLCYDERVRVVKLEKKNARLQAKLEEEEITRESLQDKLDTIEAVSEAKDATIRELQTALDKANQPGNSGDDQVEELRAKVNLLECENKDLSHKVIESAKGDWDNVLPRLELGLIQRITILSSKLKESQKELSDVKSEFANATKALSDVNVIFTELQENSERLKPIVGLALQSCRDRAASNAKFQDKLISSQKRQDALHTEFVERQEAFDTKFKKWQDASETKFGPITQAVELQPSGSPNTPSPFTLNPAKVAKSPSELELLKLKDRQTLYRQPPH